MIQIVIEIPDETYRKIITDVYDYGDMNIIFKNGTPLPKGHGRLKDADNLKNELQAYHDFLVNAWGGFKNMPNEDKKVTDTVLQCIAQIVNAPTIIEGSDGDADSN